MSVCSCVSLSSGPAILPGLGKGSGHRVAVVTEWAREVVTEWQWLQSGQGKWSQSGSGYRVGKGSGHRVAVVTGTVLGWSVYPMNRRILERGREKDRERGG